MPDTPARKMNPESLIRDALAHEGVHDPDSVARFVIGSLIAGGYQILEAEVVTDD